MPARRDETESDSEGSDYYSADEQEESPVDTTDEMMDWEASLNSISIPYALKEDSYIAKVLLCANAATHMAGIRSAQMLRDLMSPDTLELITMIETPACDHEMNIREILDLPLFTAKFTYEPATIHNTPRHIQNLIHELLARGSLVMLHGGTHYITISANKISKEETDNVVIVFSPPLTSTSVDLATLRTFRTSEEASMYVADMFHSLKELHLLSMLPGPPARTAYDAILPIYEANLLLLERTMKLSDMNADVNTNERTIASTSRQLAAEENKTHDATTATIALQAEIETVQREIEKIQTSTNNLLYEQSQVAFLQGEGSGSPVNGKGSKDRQSTWPTNLRRKAEEVRHKITDKWQEWDRGDMSTNKPASSSTRNPFGEGSTWPSKPREKPGSSKVRHLSKSFNDNS
ncbi:hypothetical protein M408DRAFT_189824 [Serendipita vermifera MAFF 305830]|uniref:Uncharacterized protein n=1 Tax=Serendipita vermifera MAFF 305830 TaxID=933852 RepID=A0A0C3BNC3_SERVB|nr:hypothetical protein M408DRAFT_189824 [Serendipita vermifera MAFF 305830]